MATKQTNQETAQCSCPVCRLFTELESAYGKKSNFFNHLNNSRVELLKAVKALVDDRIEYLEKKTETPAPRKAAKVKVE